MAQSTMTIDDAIERDLANEPQSVVRVYETNTLPSDFQEYVLTDQLGKEFQKVLERVIDHARPGSRGTNEIGIWVSGFFGSGKSHFAKIVGHLLVDTQVGDSSARDLFRRLLRSDRQVDQGVEELLQQAGTHGLAGHLVPFDIQSYDSSHADSHVGRTFLRAFHQSLGLSDIISFAERELLLMEAGKYEEFLHLFEEENGVPWDEEKDFTTTNVMFARCLSQLMPERFGSSEDLALRDIEFGLQESKELTIEGTIQRLMRWLNRRQEAVGHQPYRLVFVADEVGAWASGNLNRIEQLRTFVESLGSVAQGRIWAIVTSQERLSDVTKNLDTLDIARTRDLLQRLEARFRTNVHLESSEVGAVIENRVLSKKPSAVPELERLWERHQALLSDISGPPGLELIGNYPTAEKDRFVRDYPFLPYQLEVAAETFGSMRSIKISSGARSMIKVVFDATRDMASDPVGGLVSWDRIFDSANRGNEFADEMYLGSQGLQHLNSADQHVAGAPIERPSRVLKVLWLCQQGNRVPRTTENITRLLVDDLNTDVLRLEEDVKKTLELLEAQSFVRKEIDSNQWQFLSQEQVTLERMVNRIIEEGVTRTEVRQAVHDQFQYQVRAKTPNNVKVGKRNHPLSVEVSWEGTAIQNPGEPLKLRVALAGSHAANEAEESYQDNLHEPIVEWIVPVPPEIENRLRRMMAIERLPHDDEFMRIATEATRLEAQKLQREAEHLQNQITASLNRVLLAGTVYWTGEKHDVPLNAGRRKSGGPSLNDLLNRALRDRASVCYDRFHEGDYHFNPANITRLFTTIRGERGSLDRDLNLFSEDGHVQANHPVVERISAHLRRQLGQNAGRDLIQTFGSPPYGWEPDLIRYVTAAMLIDGLITVTDKQGRTREDPREKATRDLFTIAREFNAARFMVELDPITPEELNQARKLLQDLGFQTSAVSDIAARESMQAMLNQFTQRLSVLHKAKEIGLPLPESPEAIELLVHELSQPAPRAQAIRLLLEKEPDLRNADSFLKTLETFDQRGRFEQFRRSREMIQVVKNAGLEEDANVGSKVAEAIRELESLIEQCRVIETWEGQYGTYRGQLIQAFRDVYKPLRQRLHQRVEDARQQIMAMEEYKTLEEERRSQVRRSFLNRGRFFAESNMPELHSEEDLLAANSEYTISHIQSTLSALHGELGRAHQMIFDLFNEQQEEQELVARVETWRPADSFRNMTFVKEEEVDAAFDREKERIKELIRDGKTVRVV